MRVDVIGGRPMALDYEELPAKDVFDMSPRFDLIFKYLYALSVGEPHSVRRRILSNYIEHIRAFNNFFEADPPKATESDFVTSFDELIQSIATRGVDPEVSQLLVSDRSELVDGAHRLSTAAALGLNVPVAVTDTEAPYDYRFFSKRGLGASIMEEATRQWVHVNSSARLVVCFSNVSASQDAKIVEPLLREAGFVFHRTEFRLGLAALINLKLLAYPVRANPWVGSSEDGFAGAVSHAERSKGSYRVRVYTVRPTSATSLVEAKQIARERLGLGNYALHSTDDHVESTRLADALLSRTGRFALSLRSRGKESEVFDGMVDNFRQSVRAQGHNVDHFVLVGSSPLGALALRTPRDVDYLHLLDCSEPFFFDRGSGIDSHLDLLQLYGKTVEALILDPNNYFWHRGVKVLSPTIFLRMKCRRREWPKDFVDSGLVVRNLLKAFLRL